MSTICPLGLLTRKLPRRIEDGRFLAGGGAGGSSAQTTSNKRAAINEPNETCWVISHRDKHQGWQGILSRAVSQFRHSLHDPEQNAQRSPTAVLHLFHCHNQRFK
jgi:hypothetical protein